jgi:transposase-like protein
MSVLENKHFYDEEAAYRWVEARVWPKGPICPHCMNSDRERIGKLTGQSTRIGVRKCYACRKPFTVKIATIFESSHVKLHIWLQAMFLMCSSKKGISANQLHRTLGVTLKTAWFMAHRIREAMKDDRSSGPLGGEGKTVEVDETFVGPPEYEFRDGKWHAKRGLGRGLGRGKIAIMTLIERGGRARSVRLNRFKAPDVRAALFGNADVKSRLMTDEAFMYKGMGKAFASHETVNHSKEEYARGEAHVNTAEGFFSVFKRGMRGTYQHCKVRHLPRYLAEFDFRYNHRVALGINDVERTDAAVRSIVGKRLTYWAAGPQSER